LVAHLHIPNKEGKEEQASNDDTDSEDDFPYIGAH
jgi:hypothetical protein